MRPGPLAAATLALALAVLPALAHDGVHINDAYARFLPAARSGAAYFEIENHQTENDVLLSAASPVAESVGLHTHVEAADGMMQMRPIEGGIIVPAQSSAFLARGGDHLMFMGLTARPADGDVIPVTLTFRRAGEVSVEITVDNAREPAGDAPVNAHGGGTAGGTGDGTGGGMDHGMDHGTD